MDNDRLTQIAVRHQVFLERFKNGQVKDFLKILKKAERDTLALITGLDVDSLDQLTKRQLRGVVRQTREIQVLAQQQATQELQADLLDFAAFEADFELSSLQSVLVSKKTLKSAALRAYSAALNSPITATGGLLEPFIRDWSVNRVKQVSNLVQTGWKQGWTLNDFKKQMRGTPARNFKDGLTRKQQNQATAVIHTSTQHVSSTARAATWQSNKDVVTGYKWVSTLDSDTTETCQGLDGEVFKLGQGPTPPIHIRCRSTIVAQVSSKFDYLDDDATRSSENGPIDSDTTYYEWLNMQTKEYQVEVLGPGKAAIFDRRGVTWFEDNNIDKFFQPITLGELKEKAQLQISN